MDLLKPSLPILQGEGIGADNNSTRPNRKYLSLLSTLIATDMILDNIRRTTSSSRAILRRTCPKVITTITSLLHIKLLQQDP